MGVLEASESRVIDICMVNPGKAVFFGVSIAWERLSDGLVRGGRPALDDLLMQIEWLRTAVNHCYANRSVEPAPGPREGE